MVKDEATATDGQTGVECVFWKVFLQAGLLNRSLIEICFLFKCLNCSICIIILFLFDYYYVLHIIYLRHNAYKAIERKKEYIRI